eukprot:PhM_4_TR7046/c0_g1_i1/m.564
MLAVPNSLVTQSKHVVAYTQKYLTKYGPARSIQFHRDVERFPFQAMGLGDALSQAMHFHLAFHACVPDMLQTSSKVSNRGLGTLNLCVASMYNPIRSCRVPRSSSVEFVKGPHREHSDVNVTLWDDRYRAVGLMRLTGSRMPEDRPVLEARTTNDDDAAQISVPTPDMDDIVGADDGAAIAPFPSSRALTPCFAGKNLSCWMTFSPVPVCGLNGGEAEGITPFWTVLDAVHRYSEAVARTCPAPDNVPDRPSETLALAAFKHLTVEDPAPTEPCCIVSTFPRWYPHYPVPPWDAEVGMPQMTGGPCMTLRAELRQHNRVRSVGTYHYIRVKN